MVDTDQITVSDITKLIDLIKENINQIKAEGKTERAKPSIKYFDNTLRALKIKAKDNPTKFESVLPHLD